MPPPPPTTKNYVEPLVHSAEVGELYLYEERNEEVFSSLIFFLSLL